MTKIINLDFDVIYSIPHYKNTILILLNKQVVFRDRPDNKTAYRYYINRDNLNLNEINSNDWYNAILNINDIDIINYSKFFNLKTNIYNQTVTTYTNNKYNTTSIDYDKLNNIKNLTYNKKNLILILIQFIITWTYI